MVPLQIKITFFMILIFLSVAAPNVVTAQDDLDNLLNDLSEEVETNNPVFGTFKSPRVINGQSIEMVAPGAMEFRISHRFGRLNSGGYNLWGLDQSTIRLEFDFGVTDWFMVGFARSSFQKTYDGFLKARLNRQMDHPILPWEYFTTTISSGMAIQGQNFSHPAYQDHFSNRVSYFHMIAVGRKFNQRISLQITGALTHQNLVETTFDQNLRGIVGLGGRFKLTNRIAMTGEYFYRIPFPNSEFAPGYSDYEDSFSVGFDIETGGHVFQLHLTNTLPMMEQGFFNETTGRWLNGDIHFGFNVTREFTLFSNN